MLIANKKEGLIMAFRTFTQIEMNEHINTALDFIQYPITSIEFHKYLSLVVREKKIW
ncbi:unnamed protein product [marine sediment metagenome]|uniref:Uncharacterized protein n=1 Tax=marine sediment metagenome TaxID=412755 RepID=X0Y2L8_9ZZZZ